jgi:hypothetical protein
VLLVAAAGLAAFVITLAVLGSSAAARGRRAAEAAARAAQEERKPSPLEVEEYAPSAEDFILPRLEPAARRDAYAPFRPRRQRWSPEMVEKYWVPPRDVAAELVRSVNDRNMETFFKDVR